MRSHVVQALEPSERLALVKPLPPDPVRAVRIEAAQALAGVPPPLSSTPDRAALARARSRRPDVEWLDGKAEDLAAEHEFEVAVMASNAEAHLFNINSLEFPKGHLPGLAEAEKVAKLGTMESDAREQSGAFAAQKVLRAIHSRRSESTTTY